ncbi:4-hydroxyproline epimerase [Salinisphaera sp. LB1]|uniref:4-hydroxyproline epimerase n=1 Tax=unclassified Salinisphaera TaxID=2649847 RepID=UPI000D70709D|nr:4-hydroxyproline epimerase [Salinisphaera sp. LB1]
MNEIHVIDSHTGGEPTRLVMDGFPALSAPTMAERVDELRTKFDAWRQACLLEPRGHDVLVGALYCEPVSPDATCGVIFFNNTGYLGMCGHGTIGLVASLHHLGRIVPGMHSIDTPVGPVKALLHDDGAVTVRNVPAYRYRQDVELDVPGHGRLRGDIAWGGNWFFLVEEHGQELCFERVDALTDFTWAIRQALDAQSITGKNGALIDHIELFAADDEADSRNFVLCPGKAYDRSPCGTGTSAKLACLAADGKLAPDTPWIQAGITGSQFEGYYQREADRVRPWIKGRAYLTADATLLIDDTDPFAWGIVAR